MERWEKKGQDLYMKAGDNNMKINIYSFVHDMAKSNVNQMEGEKRYEE